GLLCVEPMSDDTMLLCESNGITKIGKDGMVIASLKGGDRFGAVSDVKPLDNGRILISDATKKTVSEFDWAGAVAWSVSGLHSPSESARLGNGNTLVADGTNVLREFDQAGNVVWSAQLSNWAAAFQRLPNGQTFVGE